MKDDPEIRRAILAAINGQSIREASPGLALRFMMDEAGFSVADAAKALKIARPNLSLMLADKRPMTMTMARRIEAVFGFPAYLLARLAFELEFARSSS
jgi:plasmid maintenance system antidote protein VapI